VGAALEVGVGLALAIVGVGEGEGELVAVGPAAPQAVTNTAKVARRPSLIIQEA
jgi:hypothetical protein